MKMLRLVYNVYIADNIVYKRIKIRVEWKDNYSLAPGTAGYSGPWTDPLSMKNLRLMDSGLMVYLDLTEQGRGLYHHGLTRRFFLYKNLQVKEYLFSFLIGYSNSGFNAIIVV